MTVASSPKSGSALSRILHGDIPNSYDHWLIAQPRQPTTLDVYSPQRRCSSVRKRDSSSVESEFFQKPSDVVRPNDDDVRESVKGNCCRRCYAPKQNTNMLPYQHWSSQSLCPSKVACKLKSFSRLCDSGCDRKSRRLSSLYNDARWQTEQRRRERARHCVLGRKLQTEPMDLSYKVSIDDACHGADFVECRHDRDWLETGGCNRSMTVQGEIVSNGLTTGTKLCLDYYNCERSKYIGPCHSHKNDSPPSKQLTSGELGVGSYDDTLNCVAYPLSDVTRGESNVTLEQYSKDKLTPSSEVTRRQSPDHVVTSDFGPYTAIFNGASPSFDNVASDDVARHDSSIECTTTDQSPSFPKQSLERKYSPMRNLSKTNDIIKLLESEPTSGLISAQSPTANSNYTLLRHLLTKQKENWSPIAIENTRCSCIDLPLSPPHHIYIKDLPKIRPHVYEWLVAVIKFAVSTSEFSALPIQDRRTLLVESWPRLLLLFMAEENFVFTLLSPPEVADEPLKYPRYCNAKKSIADIILFIEKCQKVDLDHEQYRLLRIHSLFSSGEPDVRSKEQVASASEKARRLLWQHSLTNRNVLQYGRMLLCLPLLYGIDSKVMERLFCLHVDETDVEIILDKTNNIA